MKIVKTIKKISIWGLIFSMTLGSPGMVLAQELITPTITENPPEISATPTEAADIPDQNEPTPTVLIDEDDDEDKTADNNQTTPTSSENSSVPQLENDENIDNDDNLEIEVSGPPADGPIVDNNNSTESNTDTANSANSGENKSTNENGEMVIETGQAAAYANVINLINTNLVNSNLKIVIVNNFDGDLETIDLNQIWQEAKGAQNDPFYVSGGQVLIVSNHNLAKVSNKMSVVANSGNNTAEGSGEVMVVSGQSVAIANLVNLINVNLFEAQLFLGIVNIDGALLGDLVMANPESGSTGGMTIEPVINANNQAAINDKIKMSADSGSNTTTSGSIGYIKSGDAIAGSNDYTAANATYLNQNEGVVIVNILGQSGGNIYNRLYPGSVESMAGLNQIVYYKNDGQSKGQVIGLIYNADNEVSLDNEVDVSSNSGGNQVNGMTGIIETGRAVAWANISNLVNLNILGGSRFYNFVNIFGNWNGNIVFAYPDLSVSIEADRSEVIAGDQMAFIISFDNIGFDRAENSQLEIELPDSMEYLSDNSGLIPTINGKKIVWAAGAIDAKKSREIILRVNTKQNKGLADKKSFDGMVKKAWAEEKFETKGFIITAKIEMDRNEADTNNNQDQEETRLLYPISTDRGRVSSKIEIGAKNNVNDFVNTGDIVTFEVNFINSGEGDIHNARLFHDVYDEKGQLWSTDSIYIGDIKNQQSGKVTFGIPMAGAIGGKYYTASIIKATDQTNDGVDSNRAGTVYRVKGSGAVLGSQIRAEEAVVMGVHKELGGVPSKDSYLFWYLVLMASSGSYFGIEAIKKIKLLVVKK